MRVSRATLLLLATLLTLACTQQASVAPPTTPSRYSERCPAAPATRMLSGTVVDAGGEPIYLAMVSVVNSRCSTVSDSLGHWVLAGAPLDSLVLHPSFIGYRRALFPLPASEQDSSGIVLRLMRMGEPAAHTYIPGPIPPEDLKGMLEAVISFYGPQAEVAGDELDQVAAMTGSPAPSRGARGPAVVLDSTGKSGWNQIPTQWLAEWLADSSIAAMCSGWRTPACKGFGLTSFLRLPTLPRRTAPDTAYVTPWVDVLSVLDCEKAQSMGHMSEDLLLLTRSADHWVAQRAPDGVELQGTVMCDPNWKGEP